MDVFVLTFENLLVYMGFFAAGIVFAKRKLLPDDAGRTLSFLITNLFTSAICFNTFAQKFTVAKIGEYTTLLLAGTVFMIISIFVGKFVGRQMPGNKYDKLTAEYSIVVPNYGNMGYPLVLALLGQEFLSKFMMFVLVFNFYIFGYILPQYMPGNAGLKASLKKMITAPIIMTLVGIAYGLSGLPYPAIFDNFCSMASNCLGPCSFLVVGLAMGAKPLLPALKEPRAYILTAIRLILLPALVIAAMYFLCRNTSLSTEFFMIIAIYASMPMGLNPVIFASAYGGDGALGASCALISMPAALITFPITRVIIERLAAML